MLGLLGLKLLFKKNLVPVLWHNPLQSEEKTVMRAKLRTFFMGNHLMFLGTATTGGYYFYQQEMLRFSLYQKY